MTPCSRKSRIIARKGHFAKTTSPHVTTSPDSTHLLRNHQPARRAIGSARTSVYSNLLPIVAMITAWLWLHEPIGSAKIAGAAAVLAGVALTRQP